MPTLIQFSVGIFYGHGWPVCRQRRSSCRRWPWMACMPTTQDDCMDAGGRATQEQLPSNCRRWPWMACMPATKDDCMDAGGTHPWMDAVERRREQPSRATQEQLPSSCRVPPRSRKSSLESGQLWMSQAVRLLSRIAFSIRYYSACTLTAILNSTRFASVMLRLMSSIALTPAAASKDRKRFETSALLRARPPTSMMSDGEASS